MDGPVEPSSRYGAFSATINSRFYLWGGDGAVSDDLSILHVLDSSTGSWTAKPTTGTPLSGYQNGTCASVGDIMYTYGG